MNEIKKILLPIIVLSLLSSCNSGNSTRPNDPSIDSTDSIRPIDTKGNIRIDSGWTDLRPSATCTPANSSDLLMTVIPQRAKLWCWAACGEMAMEKMKDTSIVQCDEVIRQYPKKGNCCDSSLPENCIVGGWPDFDGYGFNFNTTRNEALSWEEIKNQIDCQKAPICGTWHYNMGGGHMVVVSGYRTENGINQVFILNPKGSGSVRWLPYIKYVSGFSYTHWDDFYNIKKK